ncbi:hypothetical protein AAG906_035302 [Vitis piasezkii]
MPHKPPRSFEAFHSSFHGQAKTFLPHTRYLEWSILFYSSSDHTHKPTTLSYLAQTGSIRMIVEMGYRLDLALVLAATKLEIRSDSQLIVEHIQQEYEAKDEHMARYLAMVESHLKKLDEWVIRRVPVKRMGRQTH